MKKPVEEIELGRAGEIFLQELQIPMLSNTLLFARCSEMVSTEARGFYDIQPQEIRVGYAVFDRVNSIKNSSRVELEQTADALRLYCSCGSSKKLLCAHQAQVLFNAMNRETIRLFFDAQLRKQKLLEFSVSNGFTEQDDPETLFEPEYHENKLRIVPLNNELLLLDTKTQEYIRKQLLTPEQTVISDQSDLTQKIIVFRKHRFYDHLCIELCEAGLTREGKLKKPIRPLNPYDFLWKTSEPDELKFYTALARYANLYTEDQNTADLDGLTALVKNPLGYPVYLQSDTSNDNPALSAYVLVKLQPLEANIHIHVDKRTSMFAIRGELEMTDQILPLESLQYFFRYFIKSGNVLYFLADGQVLRLLDFFKQRKFNLLIPASVFDTFREDILQKLENSVRISYAHLKLATDKQKQESGLDASPEKILYLNNTGNYIQLIPAMRYGPVEVQIMSRRQIYTYDTGGNAISILRDEVSETDFLATLFKLMPELENEIQTGNLYIHKANFLDEDWFPDVFETFRQKQITVLGFNALTKNPINTHKAKISVLVRSGIDWFETQMDVRFGGQKARMKQLSTAVRNKSKYVQLDDGTRGILPVLWIERFARYFSAGIVADELITTPKIRFQEIAQLYESEFLDESAIAQLAQYQEKIDGLASLSPVEIPQGLQAHLRDYQKQGLNWLSLLHQFGFGGCLADDMGLGKTIQIIAFILSLKEKGETGTHLIVVPTSLLFNWKDELTRFAPALNVATVYGSDRNKQPVDFSQYDVLITSYGVLQSDIKVFKAFGFHLLVLDESQSIKNPETQRYKAVCLLQAWQRIVLTGTPLENNTFDLYGQLSFACPGLLGSKLYFKQVYSIPIDTFKESRRAKELQQKIKPFILRRTKKQVATELPEKTEILLYCEMGTEQRRIYDAYAKELREFIANKQPDDILRNSMYVLRGLTRLRQICNSPELLADKDYYGKNSSKIEALLEQIELHAANHKILVFSQFVGMLELIRKALNAREIKHEFLSGQTKNRQERVTHFRENDQVRVFLISLKAGGTGLNLTEADYVFLVDPWWNPAVENQAIDRSHRIGQTKTVTAVRLLCPDTIEDKILKLQASKQQLITDLIPTENSLLQAMSKVELLNLLSP